MMSKPFVLKVLTHRYVKAVVTIYNTLFTYLCMIQSKAPHPKYFTTSNFRKCTVHYI